MGLGSLYISRRYPADRVDLQGKAELSVVIVPIWKGSKETGAPSCYGVTHANGF